MDQVVPANRFRYGNSCIFFDPRLVVEQLTQKIPFTADQRAPVLSGIEQEMAFAPNTIVEFVRSTVISICGSV